MKRLFNGWLVMITLLFGLVGCTDSSKAEEVKNTKKNVEVKKNPPLPQYDGLYISTTNKFIEIKQGTTVVSGSRGTFVSKFPNYPTVKASDFKEIILVGFDRSIFNQICKFERPIRDGRNYLKCENVRKRSINGNISGFSPSGGVSKGVYVLRSANKYRFNSFVFGID
jgi:hypothetical protein